MLQLRHPLGMAHLDSAGYVVVVLRQGQKVENLLAAEAREIDETIHAEIFDNASLNAST